MGAGGPLGPTLGEAAKKSNRQLLFLVFFRAGKVRYKRTWAPIKNLVFRFRYYYYSINQIDICRISLNQILRSESQESHFITQ